MAEGATGVVRVLLIDGDRSTCRALEQEFRAHGADVSACIVGKDALGAIGSAAWDLAIVDIRLPDADGIDILEEIKRVSPRTRVIVVGSGANPATIRHAVAAGAELFLERPFEPFAVRVRALALLRSYAVRRRHPRHACRIPVRISLLAPVPPGAGFDLVNVKGIAENVACGGVRVATNFPLASGQVVRVKAGEADAADPYLPLIPPRATAEVRWTSVSTGGFSAGLSFTKPLVPREFSPEGGA